MKKISYWIDHTEDVNEIRELIDKYKHLKKEIHKIPCHPQTNKKFTFVRYADDWLVGVCGTKEECIALKAEIAEYLNTVHRTALLNQSDSEIVEQYNAEMRGLLNYYNLAVDYHTLDYFCYLMEYSCLKTIANKHKSTIHKIIRQYKDGKTWSVPYETKDGTKRVRPVKIADCKRGEASDTVFQRTISIEKR